MSFSGWQFIGSGRGKISLSVLFAEWVAIGALGAAAFVTFGRKKPDATLEEEAILGYKPGLQMTLGLDDDEAGLK